MKKVISIIMIICIIGMCGCKRDEGKGNGVTSSKMPYVDTETKEYYEDITEHPDYSNIEDEYYTKRSDGTHIDNARPHFKDYEGLDEYLERISKNPVEWGVLKGEGEDYYYKPGEAYEKRGYCSGPILNRWGSKKEPTLSYRYDQSYKYMLDNPDLPEETRRQLEGISTIEPEPYYVDGENVIDEHSYRMLSFTWHIKKGKPEYINNYTYEKEYPLEGIDGKYSTSKEPYDSENIVSYTIKWQQDGYYFSAVIPAQYINEPSDLIEYTKVEKVAFR